MQRILFQGIGRWALAALCLTTTTDPMTAGSFLRGRAVHDMHILDMIEHRENTKGTSAERLDDTLLTMMHVQTVSIPDQKLDALAAAMRAVTSQGLFAEEYEAILEAAQDDLQLREKIIEHIIASPK